MHTHTHHTQYNPTNSMHIIPLHTHTIQQTNMIHIIQHHTSHIYIHITHTTHTLQYHIYDTIPRTSHIHTHIYTHHTTPHTSHTYIHTIYTYSTHTIHPIYITHTVHIPCTLYTITPHQIHTIYIIQHYAHCMHKQHTHQTPHTIIITTVLKNPERGAGTRQSQL